MIEWTKVRSKQNDLFATKHVSHAHFFLKNVFSVRNKTVLFACINAIVITILAVGLSFDG